MRSLKSTKPPTGLCEQPLVPYEVERAERIRRNQRIMGMHQYQCEALLSLAVQRLSSWMFRHYPTLERSY